MKSSHEWAQVMAPLIDRAENAVAMVVSFIQQDAREDLEEKLKEANHWRARHSKESQLRGEQSNANWLHAKACREALRRMMNASRNDDTPALRDAIRDAEQLLALPLSNLPLPPLSSMPPAMVEE
jgi:hypothetical protein